MENKKILNSTIPILALFLLITSFTMAQTPSDLMRNCKQWKITYPTGVEDKTLCDEPNNEFFYVNNEKDAIVFKTPIRSDNGTTPNSDNVRSELRERVENGSADIYWTTAGTHTIYVKQAITHLPIKKPQLVATQIHGNKEAGIDDSMVMRLNKSHLYLAFNGGKLRSNVTIKTDYELGTIHEVIFKVVDGKHYCYYSEDGNLLNAYKNNNASSYLIKADGNDYVMDLNYGESYFKVGNYTQSNPTEEGEYTNDPNNYGEVLVYDFYAEHGETSVNSVTLSPKSLDLTANNNYQLTTQIIPTNAENKNVSYHSSNSNVATVNASGFIQAISVGTTIITVTSEDGNFTDTCQITIVENTDETNIALNKSITGSGTPDGIHIPLNLIDGDSDTRWSVSGYPQTAIIDLGENYQVNRTELICYSDRAYQYKISISNSENGTYTELVDRSDNSTPGTESNPMINVFPSTEGRFIKITVTGANNYTGSWISLNELKIYETNSLSTNHLNSVKNNIQLWPNPAKNNVYIQGIKDDTTLTIYDTIGKLITNRPLKEGALDISDLISGVYIFKFSNNLQAIYKTLIKI